MLALFIFSSSELTKFSELRSTHGISYTSSFSEDKDGDAHTDHPLSEMRGRSDVSSTGAEVHPSVLSQLYAIVSGGWPSTASTMSVSENEGLAHLQDSDERGQAFERSEVGHEGVPKGAMEGSAGGDHLLSAASGSRQNAQDAGWTLAVEIVNGAGLTPNSSKPAHSHYECASRCLPDEVEISVEGVVGKICAPLCGFLEPCPTDTPRGVSARPQCALQDESTGQRYCALLCSTPTMNNATAPTTAAKASTFNTTMVDQKEGAAPVGDAQCGPEASCKKTRVLGSDVQYGIGICMCGD